MKEYNAKIIVDNDKVTILYECDKQKNIYCPGYGNCRECNLTTDSRYAKASSGGYDRTQSLIKELQDTLYKYKQLR